jgi:hypothetical protein
MEAPRIDASFVAGLERDFGGKIRARWSTQRNRWQIERKGRELPGKIDLSDRVDRRTRLQDGYYRILEVSPGSLVCCGRCQKDYKAEIFNLAAPRCPHCDNLETVLNWPLGENLLEYLRRSDPDRDGLDRMERDQKASEEAAEKAADRERANYGEDVWKDEFTNIFEIQSKGYTGKEAAWENAPESKRFGGNA